MPINSTANSVQRYVLVPSSILADSERNALLDQSRLNAASSTVNRIERQIASIASDPTLSSEHKAKQLRSAVSGLDSATRDYLHTVADVNNPNTVVSDEPVVNDANVEEESSITAPYYTRPVPDQAPIAPVDESLAGRETLTFQQPPVTMIRQCSTILLKVAEKVTADTLERAMARLATETARFDVAATVEWGGALCSVVGAAAGTGQPSTVDGWLWAAVGLLLTAVLVQTGYVNRAVVERALRSARDYIRRCRRDRSPLPPTRPPPTRLPPLALGSCLPPPFIQFSTLDPPT
uniref:Transmembrane protein n=1 Tax=Plectus sambesii TaxID=2011161 RepID=A0A914XFX4_9BILA